MKKNKIFFIVAVVITLAIVLFVCFELIVPKVVEEIKQTQSISIPKPSNTDDGG